MKEKPTSGSSFFGVSPSDHIPRAKEDVSVHIFNHSCTFRDKPIMDNALTVQTCLQHKFPLPLSTQNLLLQGGGDDYFHSEDCCFVCGSYTKHRVASPVIMLLRNLSLSAISMRSLEMFMFLCVCAPAFKVPNVDKCGTSSTQHEE